MLTGPSGELKRREQKRIHDEARDELLLEIAEAVSQIYPTMRLDKAIEKFSELIRRTQ